MEHDEIIKRAIEETCLKFRKDGYTCQHESIGGATQYVIFKDGTEIATIRISRANELWKVSPDPIPFYDGPLRGTMKIFWDEVQKIEKSFEDIATFEERRTEIIHRKQEKQINYIKLDEFREKKNYGQLLFEYQALLMFANDMPKPASIRKEIHNIAFLYDVGFVDKHPNEDTIKFEFQYNGQACFITVAEQPQSGAAVMCPPIEWSVDNRYTFIVISSLDKSARQHAQKIALAALSKAVTSENDTPTGDVIPKLMDVAESIFKEFNENSESESRTKPQSGKPPLSDDELADRKDKVDKWRKKSKEYGRQRAADLMGTPYTTLLSWEKKVYPRNE